jgi:hypothetical protein
LDEARVHLLPFSELDGVGLDARGPGARSRPNPAERALESPTRPQQSQIKGSRLERRRGALTSGNPLIWAYARGGSSKQRKRAA